MTFLPKCTFITLAYVSLESTNRVQGNQRVINGYKSVYIIDIMSLLLLGLHSMPADWTPILLMCSFVSRSLPFFAKHDPSRPNCQYGGFLVMPHGSCPQIEGEKEEDQTVKTEPQSNWGSLLMKEVWNSFVYCVEPLAAVAILAIL